MIRQDMKVVEKSPAKLEQRRRNGFTLMEMLVVVAIIVALAGMGGFYFIGQLNESKKSSAKIQAKVLLDAVDTYYIRHGDYPGNLGALVTGDPNTTILKSTDALKDPWGNEYIYQVGGGVPDIYSQSPYGPIRSSK